MNASPAIHVSDPLSLISEVKKAYLGYLNEFDIEDPVIIVNNSGGKDSGATDLLAREIFGDNYRSVAADTGNEHPLTIQHLKQLHEQRGGNPVEIVQADYPQELFDKRKQSVIKGWSGKQTILAGKYRGILMPSLSNPDTKFAEAWRKQAKRIGMGEFSAPIDAFLHAFHRTGNPFLDMTLLHGGFPLGRQRFCTQELKIDVVFNKVIRHLLDECKTVIQWSGVRADESEKRAAYGRFTQDDRDKAGDLFNFLPIHKWTAADVFSLYKYFGVKPNPLYTQGMARVGCMPCVLVNKEELSEIAARFPDEINRVNQWEKQIAMVSRWVHWMMVGHIDRRQFKPIVSQFYVDRDISDEHINDHLEPKKYAQKLGVNSRLIHRDHRLQAEQYTGTSMLGPRGDGDIFSIYDAIEWAKTGRGGKVYDLVKASLNVEVCSSKYGLCG